MRTVVHRAVGLLQELGIDAADVPSEVDTFLSVNDIIRYCASRHWPAHDTLRLDRRVILTVALRDYQTRAVEAVIDRDERGTCVRSGMIVLPCGSGKTLVGCAIAYGVGVRCIVMTTNATHQWKATLARWFPTLRVMEVGVDVFTPSYDVALLTYTSAVASTQAAVLNVLRLGCEVLLLDEVHAAAADCHLKMIQKIRCKVCVGLTATPVREDERFKGIESFVGRVLHASHRSDLVRQGYLSQVHCENPIVPMPFETTTNRASVLNPYKIAAMDAILHYLAGEKTIVFCDDVRCLKMVHTHLVHRHVSLCGPLSMESTAEERKLHMRRFQCDRSVITMSRVGDEAFDIPEASALIVLWNGWASRRQLIQRLGRISRPGHVGRAFVLLSDIASELERAKHRDTFVAREGYPVTTRRFETHPWMPKDGARIEACCDALVDSSRGGLKRRRQSD
jgi:DNA excision repair protein ERCC-3